MRVSLVALNARFTHSNLALRYLRSYVQAEFPEVLLQEFNINQHHEDILEEIARKNPEVIGFSCYIWNIQQILPLCLDLKVLLPQTTLLLGGPEVSFDAKDLLASHQAVDFVMVQEGELGFLHFLRALEKKEEDLSFVPNLVYRRDGLPVENPVQSSPLDQIPLVYQGELLDLKDRIVYYETSRGCPYCCSYCLSSTTKGVRFFPLERAFTELQHISNQNVHQVRFVDRTFNANNERAVSLVRFVNALQTKTRFHLEIHGDTLSKELLFELKRAKKGRIHLEIGVQSTHTSTLCAIHRQTDLGALRRNVVDLRENSSAILLLDLIAGLPHENLKQFGESFDYVYHLRPHKIHLGFLKLLKGSALRQDAFDYGIFFSERAPYAMLYTKDLSFSDRTLLKLLSHLVERYYNSQRFSHTLRYLCSLDTPFSFFLGFAQFYREKGYDRSPHSVRGDYGIVLAYKEKDPLVCELLRLDYRLNEEKMATPGFLGGREDRSLENELIRERRLLASIPELKEQAPRILGRSLFVEDFSYQVYPVLGAGPQRILFFWDQGQLRVFPLEE